MRVLLTALLALASFAPAARAAEGGPASAVPRATAVFSVAPSGWYAEARSGFATQDLGDPDANIAFMERIAMDSLGAPGPLRRFENAQAFAIEVGRRRGAWSFGVATEHQRERVRTFAAGTRTGSLDVISLMSTIDVRLVASYRPRALFGFEAGASAGLAFAHYSEQFALDVFAGTQYDANSSGAFHATSFSGGPHLGWRRPLYGNTWLVARGAWLWRNFGELKGQYKQRSGSGTAIDDSSMRRLDSGGLASIDGTGVQVSAGLTHTFWGRH